MEQTAGFAEAMGELTNQGTLHPTVEVCGSPGEVGNQPELGHRMPLRKQALTFNSDTQADLIGGRAMTTREGKQSVHMMIMLYAPDQVPPRGLESRSLVALLKHEGSNPRRSSLWC